MSAQITLEERYAIMGLRKARFSIRAIAADSAEIARLFQCKPHTVTVEAEQR
jgi:IS30 family transposase